MKVFENLHAFIWLNPTVNNCNSYFIDDEKKILVDPGHHHLFRYVEDQLQGLSLSHEDMDIVILTHGHPDHIEGVRVFSDTPALIALHGTESDFIRKFEPHPGKVSGVSEFEPHILLQEGDMKIGGLNFRVVHTPGHSPGSICLYWSDRKVLFTGDLVFNQGIGRTDLPGGSGEELKESIRKISRLEVDFLLPGHGEIISGGDLVRANFVEIERLWFPYL
jgi:hydroxyacylglutathione hydrolase